MVFPLLGLLMLQNSHLCLDVAHLSGASAFNGDQEIDWWINRLTLTWDVVGVSKDITLRNA